VTHLDVDDDGIDRAVKVLEPLVAKPADLCHIGTIVCHASPD